MSLDIFNPSISTVPKGIEGKTMLWYGSNRTGKTYQATKANKPYYLAFEKGINAIAGIPFAPIQKWADFRKLNKQLTNPTTLEKAKELYQTIIFGLCLDLGKHLHECPQIFMKIIGIIDVHVAQGLECLSYIEFGFSATHRSPVSVLMIRTRRVIVL